MITNTNERIETLSVERNCSCICTCIKKERTCTLTILGAFQVFIAVGSLAVGNWAVFSFPEHLRKTAAYPFWSGAAVSDVFVLFCLDFV